MPPTSAGEPGPVTQPNAWADFLASGFLRRLGVTLALLAMYRVASFWPAAGIDLSATRTSSGQIDAQSFQLVERLSPVALGLLPVFTVLSILEFAKLALPTLKFWIDASSDNRHTFHRRVLVASLLLAAFQAYGMSVALQDYESSRAAMAPPLLVATGTSFTIIFIVSQVVGTAFCIWIADKITRHGLGSGFWLLYAFPTLAGFAVLPSTLMPFLENGTLAPHAILISAAALIASALAIAAIVRQWMHHGPASVAVKTAQPNIATTDALSIVIWPPFLGVGIGGLLIGIVTGIRSLFGVDETGAIWFAPGTFATLALTMILIWLFTSLIANSVLKPALSDTPDTRRLVQQTALVTSVTYAAIELLVWKIEMPLVVSGPIWIALVTVMVLLLPTNISRYVPTPQTLNDDDFSST